MSNWLESMGKMLEEQAEAEAQEIKAMTMKPCKHLDYDGEYIDCEIRTCAPHYPDIRYWHRNNPPYEGAPVKVQFCKKRGRINGIFDCYNVGEMSCYECDA